MKKSFSLLILEDDLHQQNRIAQAFKTKKDPYLYCFKIFKARSASRFLAILEENPIDLVSIDLELKTELSHPYKFGLQAIKECSKRGISCFVLSHYSFDYQYNQQALDLGALAVVDKRNFEESLEHLFDLYQLREDNPFLERVSQKYSLPLSHPFLTSCSLFLTRKERFSPLVLFGGFEEERIHFGHFISSLFFPHYKKRPFVINFRVLSKEEKREYFSFKNPFFSSSKPCFFFDGIESLSEFELQKLDFFLKSSCFYEKKRKKFILSSPKNLKSYSFPTYAHLDIGPLSLKRGETKEKKEQESKKNPRDFFPHLTPSQISFIKDFGFQSFLKRSLSSLLSQEKEKGYSLAEISRKYKVSLGSVWNYIKKESSGK